jgi:hypothetical protein
VPARLPGAVHRRPMIDAAADRVLVRVPEFGRLLARAAGPVLVDAADPEPDVGCFLTGAVGTAALLLRGVPALRAAAVSIDGAGVLLCGRSGVGKSTAVAALALRGHLVLADRVVLVDGTPPAVVPLVEDGVRLGSAVAALLGLAGGRVVRRGLPARVYPLPAATAPVPVRGALLLTDQRRVRPVSTVDSPVERIGALLGHEWHPLLYGPLGLESRRFGWLTALAAACRVVRVNLGDQPGPAELGARIEALVSDYL